MSTITKEYQKHEIKHMDVLYGNIDQTLVNSLCGMLNFEIGGLDCRVITTEYRRQSIEPVSIVHTCNTYFVVHWSI